MLQEQTVEEHYGLLYINTRAHARTNICAEIIRQTNTLTYTHRIFWKPILSALTERMKWMDTALDADWSIEHSNCAKIHHIITAMTWNTCASGQFVYHCTLHIQTNYECCMSVTAKYFYHVVKMQSDHCYISLTLNLERNVLTRGQQPFTHER